MRPKVVRTVHHSVKGEKNNAAYMEVSYHDQTSLTGYPTSSVYPTKDRDNNPTTTEFGLSHYADHQTLSIQEMPENAPAGLLPSSIDVVLDDDLVDSCKPGDRVSIVGIYRALPSKSGAEGSGVFKAVLIANHVKQMTAGGSVGVVELTAEDTRNIRKTAARRDCFQLLARSIAPSIYGHSLIKEALLLLLLGGCEKNLANGTHIRGDINLLMVGDPSTAKSQLLRFILHIAPLAINTTGRGSSGVGLTAAVTSDKETGDRRLEAGAMVLADRGVVCIDEFDKMSDADRVAIHEVMEQQTVTIAKAGIHMALNARCSVVAAANPRYSHYDKNKSPAFNVNLPDSLLSRFDLLFIVLDTPDAAMDRRVADRVLNNHRYVERRGPHTFDEGEDDEGGEDAHEKQGQSIFQRFDPLLHQSASASRSRRAEQQVLSMPFLKKFLQYAKRMEPVLTDDAATLIGRMYAELRTDQATKANGYPITARCLETLIRLSTAHAKSRLSEEVEEEDVREAMRVIKSAIDGSKDEREEEKERREQEADERKAGGRGDGGDDDDDDDDEKYGGDDDHEPRTRRRTHQEEDEQKQKRRAEDDAEEGEEEEKGPSPSSRRRRRASGAMDVDSPQWKRRVQEEEEGGKAVEGGVVEEGVGRGGRAVEGVVVEEVVTMSSVRGQVFVKALARLFYDESVLSVDAALTAINADVAGRAFTRGEAEQLLQQLEQANKVMLGQDGQIYRI